MAAGELMMSFGAQDISPLRITGCAALHNRRRIRGSAMARSGPDSDRHQPHETQPMTVPHAIYEVPAYRDMTPRRKHRKQIAGDTGIQGRLHIARKREAKVKLLPVVTTSS
jgi:hypothetical protein